MNFNYHLYLKKFKQINYPSENHLKGDNIAADQIY
jgi:hypothetical protein